MKRSTFMKTNVLRFISTVLVMSICLTILPSFPAFAQEPFVQTVTPIDPEYISLQQLQTMVLPEEDRPEAVESYLVEQKGHVLRLREQEEDLNTVVFQNRDGNKTMYYFDQPVKYVDENGNIKDKKTTVTSVIDKAEYSTDYGFVTGDNDIKTYFPKKLVGNKGILVEYQDVKIEVIPLSAEKNVLSSAQKKQDLVDSQTRDSVEYNKAFGNNTLLKYTPTFGGFKEDIILASYAGKNEFSFKIKTNGLALVCEDGKYYLADPATNEKLMQVGDIVVYDSSMVPNTTPSVPVLNPVKPEPKELTEEEKNALYFPEGPLDPVYEHYYQLETVKEAEEYILTIVVDEDYLTCEDTVYPVTIDPSLTVVGSSFLDTTIYTNYSSAQGSSLNMFVGNHATRYGGTRGVARALIRFPGLFSNSTFASLSADDISHVDFMIRDTMCEGDGVWIDCYRLTQSWSESTAVYSSALWNGYVGFIDDEYVQYNGGTGSDGTGTGHWYHFNITNVVKEWLDGYYGGVSNHYGIMLKAFEETDPAKTFGTSENADYPPKVVVDYDDNSGGGDNEDDDSTTTVTSVQFSQDEYVVPVGWSGTFDVIVNPEGAVSGGFNWVLIGAQDIATINYTTGVFTALAEGTKTLFVGAKNGGTGDSCTIRIVNSNSILPGGPNVFKTLINSYMVDVSDIKSTSDNLYICTKSLADILLSSGINYLYESEDDNEGVLVSGYYDDWYLLAVPSSSDYSYGLYKMREQENDSYDNNDPGVTISFVSLDTDLLLTCINSSTAANKIALFNDLYRVTTQPMPEYDDDLQEYFGNTASKGAYLIAEEYIMFIASFANGGYIDLPNNYLSILSEIEQLNESLLDTTLSENEIAEIQSDLSKAQRVPNAVSANNQAAGYDIVVISPGSNRIYINSPNNLTAYEKYAILMTHTANITFNSFVAEVEFHADMLKNVLSLYPDIYKAAIRSDMAIGEEYEGDPFDDVYYDLESDAVQEQIQYHGEY